MFALWDVKLLQLLRLKSENTDSYGQLIKFNVCRSAIFLAKSRYYSCARHYEENFEINFIKDNVYVTPLADTLQEPKATKS